MAAVASIAAWYMDAVEEDQCAEHKGEPFQAVSVDELRALGVLTRCFDPDSADGRASLESFCTDRGYDYRDIINITPERLPNYDAKVRGAEGRAAGKNLREKKQTPASAHRLKRSLKSIYTRTRRCGM